MLARKQRNWNLCAFLLVMYNAAGAIGISLVIPKKKINMELPYDTYLPISLPGTYLKVLKAGAQTDVYIPEFILVLFTVSKR